MSKILKEFFIAIYPILVNFYLAYESNLRQRVTWEDLRAQTIAMILVGIIAYSLLILILLNHQPHISIYSVIFGLFLSIALLVPSSYFRLLTLGGGFSQLNVNLYFVIHGKVSILYSIILLQKIHSKTK